MEYWIKGILIGLMFGIPIGAVGALTIQATLSGGIKKGIITGLGSTAADMIYASVGAFGLTLISGFLLAYSIPIQVVGSVFIILLALLSFFKKTKEQVPINKGYAKSFLSSFVIGITNPTSILTFLFAFSVFHLENIATVWQGIGLVIGVIIGTGIWWIAITLITKAIASKIKTINFNKINKVFAVLLFIIALAVFIQIWL